MMERQEQQRNLGDYRLVVSVTPLKFIIRAYEHDSEDYLFAEYKNGSLPADIAEYYESQDAMFRVLMGEEGVRIGGQKLYIPYSKTILGRAVKKEFMIPLGRVQGNEVAKLRTEVARLTAEVERLAQFQEKVKLHEKIIQVLSERSQIYFYSPGQIIPLQFPQIPENSYYRLRDRFLDKKPEERYNQSPRYTKLVGDRIDNEIKVFTYQTTVKSGSGFVFIGLATKNQQHNGFNGFNGFTGKTMPNTFLFLLQQKQMTNSFRQNKQKYMLTNKNSHCDFFFDQINKQASSSKKRQMTKGKKGDIFALTVNLLQNSLTWFKNGRSIERSYFTSQDPTLYPFIILDDGIEVII